MAHQKLVREQRKKPFPRKIKKEISAEETEFNQEETQRRGKLSEKERALMKKCQRAIKHYKEQEERVGEIRNGIESQIRNDSRRLWQWIGRQLYGEKSRKAMVIKKGSDEW